MDYAVFAIQHGDIVLNIELFISVRWNLDNAMNGLQITDTAEQDKKYT